MKDKMWLEPILGGSLFVISFILTAMMVLGKKNILLSENSREAEPIREGLLK